MNDAIKQKLIEVMKALRHRVISEVEGAIEKCNKKGMWSISKNEEFYTLKDIEILSFVWTYLQFRLNKYNFENAQPVEHVYIQNRFSCLIPERSGRTGKRGTKKRAGTLICVSADQHFFIAILSDISNNSVHSVLETDTRTTQSTSPHQHQRT